MHDTSVLKHVLKHFWNTLNTNENMYIYMITKYMFSVFDNLDHMLCTL
jgi:hypothetical protein